MALSNFFSDSGTTQLSAGVFTYRFVRKAVVNQRGVAANGAWRTGYLGDFDARRPVIATTGAIVPVLEKVGNRWRFDVYGPNQNIAGEIFIFDAGDWENVTSGIKIWAPSGELTFSSGAFPLRILKLLSFAVPRGGAVTEASRWDLELTSTAKRYAVITCVPHIESFNVGLYNTHTVAIHHEPSDGNIYMTRVTVPDAYIYSLKPVPRTGRYMAIDVTGY